MFCHDASQIDQLSFHEHEKKYRKSLVIICFLLLMTSFVTSEVKEFDELITLEM